MKSLIIIIFLLTALSGCQTARIKNEKYKISSATTELGSIGHGKTIFNIENNFTTKSFPELKNKIRLDIQILPFNEKLDKVYSEKAKVNQSQNKINYIDSIPTKPEFVTVSIMDLTGYANELNQPHNKNILTYLDDTKEAVVITRVALALPGDDLVKLRQADTYYLVNEQERKYTIELFKQGKRTDTIDLNLGVPLAYKLGRFCWAESERHKWYIGDIVEDSHGCKGMTKYEAREKKTETNLFKM
jgi:hypothetical protein